MAKKSKSALQNVLNKSIGNHAADETEYNQEFIDLPPGIRGGIATLIECRFGEYQRGDNQGESFVYMAGTVLEPETHSYNPQIFVNGKVETQEAKTVRTKGQRTSLMVPLCNTKKSNGDIVKTDEHVESLLNELRKLGADTSELKSSQDLETLMTALVEEGPYFKFGTTASRLSAANPESRTWENWYGDQGLEDYEPIEADEIVDNTDEAEEPDLGEQADEDVVAQLDLTTLGERADEGDENAVAQLTELCEAANIDPDTIADWAGVAMSLETLDAESTEAEESEEDLAALGAKADPPEEDEEAQNTLSVQAEELGIDPNDFGTWVEVAVAIQSASDEKPNIVPEKGEIYSYKPPRARRFVEAIVVSVNQKSSICTLKNLEDGKTVYKNIPWDKLVVGE